MTSGGGGPSAFAISRAGCSSATSTCLRRDRVQPAEHAVGGLRAVRQRRYPEPEQRLLDEVLMGLRDQLAEVLLAAPR